MFFQLVQLLSGYGYVDPDMDTWNSSLKVKILQQHQTLFITTIKRTYKHESHYTTVNIAKPVIILNCTISHI